MKFKDFDFEAARLSLFRLYHLLEILEVVTPGDMFDFDEDTKFVHKMGWKIAIPEQI